LLLHQQCDDEIEEQKSTVADVAMEEEQEQNYEHRDHHRSKSVRISSQRLHHVADEDNDDNNYTNNDDITTINNNKLLLGEAKKLLYLAQSCSQFSEWIWQFGSTIWLARLSNYSSLFLNSAYQATTQVLLLVMVPRLLSSCIDNSIAVTPSRVGGSGGAAWNRSQFAFYLITAQTACIVLATISFGWTLNWSDGNSSGDGGDNRSTSSNQSEKEQDVNAVLWVCSLVAICIFGGLAQVFNKSFLVAVERDWIVVMADCDEVWLRRTNVALKQIYITCQIVGPALTGYVMLNGGGVAWIGASKALSLCAEYVCLNQVYRMLPILQTRGDHSKDSGRSMSSSEAALGKTDDDHRNDSALLHLSDGNDSTAACYCQKDLRVYSSQTMAWAGLGLALLYCNVLHLGGTMTAYLASCGMSLTVIGIWQGISNLVGLLGTFSFSLSQKYMNLESSEYP